MKSKRLLIIGVLLVFMLCVAAACGTGQEELNEDVPREDVTQNEEELQEEKKDGENDRAALPEPGNGYVTICYGDQDSSVYENAFPLHSEYGFPGVNYVITSKVGSEGKMTVQQLKEMESAGWETASHTVKHEELENMDKEEVEKEILESAEWLEEQGLMSNSFSYPYGSARLEDFAKENYESLVHRGNSLNFAPVDPHELTWIPLYKGNMDQVNYKIDRAAEKNGWAILYTHRVYEGEKEPDEYSVNASELKEVFEKIDENDLEVVNISEGIKLMSKIGGEQ